MVRTRTRRDPFDELAAGVLRPGRIAFATGLLFLAGCVAPPDPAQDQLARSIAAADAALDELRPGHVSEYNRALAAIASEFERHSPEEIQPRLAQHGIELHWPPAPLPLKRLHVARPVKSKDDSATVGVAMVMEYDTREATLHPPEGVLLPATLVLQRSIDGDSRRVVLLRRESKIALGGAEFDLAVDEVTPVAMTARRARPLARSALASMFRPDRMARQPQIYLIDPYDPDKMPVLMVHGLKSTPVAFARLVSAMHSDPIVNRHYQIWHFHYATGTPVMANAALLREKLAETIRAVDPLDRDPATRNIIVLGHSMGGVISHTLVSSSGEALWSSLFTVPPEELDGDRDTIRQLHEALYFERNPRIIRAIFLATPHRGSPVSDSWLGGFATLMSRLPALMETGFNSLARLNPAAMTPEGAAFYNGRRFTAVRTLSARSPTLLALADLSIEVPFHTIAGQVGSGPREQGSDGVVPYASAHLEGADSELVVPGRHKTYNNPIAIEEVLRILRAALPPPMAKLPAGRHGRLCLHRVFSLTPAINQPAGDKPPTPTS